MKAFIVIASLALTTAAGAAVAEAGSSSGLSHDACTTKSVHGLWDCR